MVDRDGRTHTERLSSAGGASLVQNGAAVQRVASGVRGVVILQQHPLLLLLGDDGMGEATAVVCAGVVLYCVALLTHLPIHYLLHPPVHAIQ